MKFAVEFRPRASADVAEAFSWYERQQPGLGDEFEADLGDAVNLLREMAGAGPTVHRDLRRVLLRRFPFAVYHHVQGQPWSFGVSSIPSVIPEPGSDVCDA